MTGSSGWVTHRSAVQTVPTAVLFQATEKGSRVAAVDQYMHGEASVWHAHCLMAVWSSQLSPPAVWSLWNGPLPPADHCVCRIAALLWSPVASFPLVPASPTLPLLLLSGGRTVCSSTADQHQEDLWRQSINLLLLLLLFLLLTADLHARGDSPQLAGNWPRKVGKRRQCLLLMLILGACWHRNHSTRRLYVAKMWWEDNGIIWEKIEAITTGVRVLQAIRQAGTPAHTHTHTRLHLALANVCLDVNSGPFIDQWQVLISFGSVWVHFDEWSPTSALPRQLLRSEGNSSSSVVARSTEGASPLEHQVAGTGAKKSATLIQSWAEHCNLLQHLPTRQFCPASILDESSWQPVASSLHLITASPWKQCVGECWRCRRCCFSTDCPTQGASPSSTDDHHHHRARLAVAAAVSSSGWLLQLCGSSRFADSPCICTTHSPLKPNWPPSAVFPSRSLSFRALCLPTNRQTSGARVYHHHHHHRQLPQLHHHRQHQQQHYDHDHHHHCCCSPLQHSLYALIISLYSPHGLLVSLESASEWVSECIQERLSPTSVCVCMREFR